MKHGWFIIPDVQTGEREIKERVRPLRPLLKHVKGASILDVGCAEGCISKWLIDAGKASTVHGIELHQPWIDTARELMPSPPYKARFTHANIMDWDESESFELTPGGYDVVLALNVIQKVPNARKVLLGLSKLAKKFFVYSGPDDALYDVRSNFDRIDVAKVLEKNFVLWHRSGGIRHKEKGHLGVRLIFKRREGK